MVVVVPGDLVVLDASAATPAVSSFASSGNVDDFVFMVMTRRVLSYLTHCRTVGTQHHESDSP